MPKFIDPHQKGESGCLSAELGLGGKQAITIDAKYYEKDVLVKQYLCSAQDFRRQKKSSGYASFKPQKRPATKHSMLNGRSISLRVYVLRKLVQDIGSRVATLLRSTILAGVCHSTGKPQPVFCRCDECRRHLMLSESAGRFALYRMCRCHLSEN